jgi:23S rRNA pseudouridine1911/1915/1917 synthase
MDLEPQPPGPESRPVDLVIHRVPDAPRLDSYLAGTFPGHSRSLLQKAIEVGAVTVNGKPAKSSQKLREGDQIRLWLPPPAPPTVVPEDIPLTVVYEDDYLAVINKPPNMVVHPAKGNWSGTLVNALQFHFNHLSMVNGAYRPGIVHRLDRDTSGAILIAKEEATHRDLSQQFEERRIFKEYLAIGQGVLDRDSDYVEKPIGHHDRDRTKMATYDEADEDEAIKDALTYYEVIERFDGYTYFKCHPKTGRTHQIRVHMAFAGAPVLADKAYSGRDCLRLSDLVRNLAVDRDEVLMNRQALHAHRLRFLHPRTRKWFEAEAPLPDDFERTLGALRRHRAV